jgi:hypothetical protein
MLAAWVRRNSRQPGPDLREAGASPAWASGRRTVDGDTRKPSLPSSPLIRRWPPRGFSRASRGTRTRTSVGTGGRPRRLGACRHFRRTSARCQRNNVRGVTRSRPREERGRWHAASASRARSAARSCGRAPWRRRTLSSWRRTSSSMSLTSRPRRLRTSAPSRARNATYRNEKVTAPILPTRPAKSATRALAPFKPWALAATRHKAPRSPRCPWFESGSRHWRKCLLPPLRHLGRARVGHQRGTRWGDGEGPLLARAGAGTRGAYATGRDWLRALKSGAHEMQRAG